MKPSIGATIDHRDQSNYAVANSFLASVAYQRQLASLPGTSLVLPMVLGVGMVTENDCLETKIRRRGLYGVDEREMLRGFETAPPLPPLHPAPHTPTQPSSWVWIPPAAGADTDDWALDLAGTPRAGGVMDWIV